MVLCWACCHGEDVRSDVECWITAVGRGLVFGVCDACAGFGWRVCRDGFFMDCESGSGAFWARRTPRWVFAGSRERFGEGWQGGVRDGVAWVV